MVKRSAAFHFLVRKQPKLILLVMTSIILHSLFADELWTLLKAESPDSDEDEPHTTTTTTTTTGMAASANSSGGNQNNNNNNNNSNIDSRPSYSRADLCEVNYNHQTSALCLYICAHSIALPPLCVANSFDSFDLLVLVHLFHVQVEPVAVACMLRIFLRYILEVEGLTTKGFTKQQNTCYLKTLEVKVSFLCVCAPIFRFCNLAYLLICLFAYLLICLFAYFAVFFVFLCRRFCTSCCQVCSA